MRTVVAHLDDPEPGSEEVRPVELVDAVIQEREEIRGLRSDLAAKNKPAADDPARKPIELGSKDDFQLMQALNHLKGAPVVGQPPKTVAAAKVPGG